MPKLVIAFAIVGSISTSASAQLITSFGASGSAQPGTCTDTSGTGPCNIQFGTPQNFGGQHQNVSSSLTFSSANGSSSAVAFTSQGVAYLPQIRAEVDTSGNARIGENITTYQSYVFVGSVATPLALDLFYHYTNSSQGDTLNEYPGESFGQIVTSVLAGNPFAGQGNDLKIPFGGIFCGASAFGSNYSPLATGYVTAMNTTGQNTLSTTISAGCDGSPLILQPGEKFTVATFSQFAANRGGFIDALHTAGLTLSSTLTSEQRDYLTANLEPFGSVPEPGTWAMMLLGFAGIGTAMRRKKAPPVSA